LEGRHSKFRSLLIKFTSSLVGLLGPVTSGIGQPASDASRISLLNMRKKLNRNHRSSSWSSTTPTVCEEVLGRHSKFSLVACCHLCGMTRLPGSYSRAMYSFFADIISELILSFKARCKFLSSRAVGFTNTKMVGSDMVVGCNESISYLLWFCSN